MKKTFKLDGQEYVLKSYDDNDVCNYLFDKIGMVADKTTVAEYQLLKYMLNNGFTPYPSYYGRPTGCLYPQLMWYGYSGVIFDEKGDYAETIEIKVCCKLNYCEADKNEVVVYEGKDRCFKIGSFRKIEDVIKFFKLHDYLPVKVQTSNASVDRILDRVENVEKAMKEYDVDSPYRPESFIGVYDGEYHSHNYFVPDYSKLTNVNNLVRGI